MQITSRYNGKCKRCGGFLPQGSEIEWARETGATHLGECPERKQLTDAEGAAAVREALRIIADDDPDRAGEWNEVGFSGVDTDFGHSLAEKDTWSEKQLGYGKRLVWKYRRQLTARGYTTEQLEALTAGKVEKKAAAVQGPAAVATLDFPTSEPVDNRAAWAAYDAWQAARPSGDRPDEDSAQRRRAEDNRRVQAAREQERWDDAHWSHDEETAALSRQHHKDLDKAAAERKWAATVQSGSDFFDSMGVPPLSELNPDGTVRS